MYEDYTNQCVPSKKYRELIGTAMCIFNSNNAFVIENILREDVGNNYTWYGLMDKMSGKLPGIISGVIESTSGEAISNLFGEIIDMRNRIIHSFQVTADSNTSDDIDYQLLATKDRNNEQYFITEEYLMDFISKNDTLSDMLHKLRGN